MCSYKKECSAGNRKYTSMILLVLQEAFDTLDNRISLDKIKYISFSVKQLNNVMISFLPHKQNWGVSQRSILGHLDIK